MVRLGALCAQAALRRRFGPGFSCACGRCLDEGKQDKQLQQLVLDVYSACSQQLKDDLVEAVAR